MAQRILVVDDDPDILALEEKVLTREGYEVTVAQSGPEALQLIEQEEFDLVLLDIMMPGMDGYEVSRTLRQGKRQSHLPVVFVTARDDSASMREGFSSGGTVFLSKPFTAIQLARLVRSLLPG